MGCKVKFQVFCVCVLLLLLFCVVVFCCCFFFWGGGGRTPNMPDILFCNH